MLALAVVYQSPGPRIYQSRYRSTHRRAWAVRASGSVDGLVGWLVNVWLVGWLVGWLAGWLVNGLLVDERVGRWMDDGLEVERTGRSVDWLIDRFAGGRSVGLVVG